MKENNEITLITTGVRKIVFFGYTMLEKEMKMTSGKECTPRQQHKLSNLLGSKTYLNLQKQPCSPSINEMPKILESL